MAVTIRYAILAKNLWGSNDFFLSLIQSATKPVNFDSEESLKTAPSLVWPIIFITNDFKSGMSHL